MKTGLAFSGGKDSWACLWLNKEKLQDIEVIWIDTGKNYPELLETIKLAKTLCPNFTTVKVDREGQNDYNGIPSDLVPVAWTKEGHESSGDKGVKVQSYLQCCFENRALNLLKYCQIKGITELICGQRNDESHKSTSRNGDVVGGVKRLHPIEEWSEKQVLEFLSLHMELPEHFKFKHSSMDCYDCTAYRKETKDLSEHRKVNWPLLDLKYMERKNKLDIAINEVLINL